MLLSRSPLYSPRRALTVRLACVKRAASVRPEPGSNSLKIVSFHPSQDAITIFRALLALLALASFVAASFCPLSRGLRKYFLFVSLFVIFRVLVLIHSCVV